MIDLYCHPHVITSEYSSINVRTSPTLLETSLRHNGSLSHADVFFTCVKGNPVMKQNNKIRAESKVRASRGPPHYVSIHAPLRAAEAKRSVRNILQWNCYLPADCVKNMVRMGWDFTT
jgi:hypothetical protein